MEIKEQDIYRGRNIYCNKPAIKLVVDAKDLGEISTNEIAGFNE